MAERLRDKSGRVFLACEQLMGRSGYTKFNTDEDEFETVVAKPKRAKKKVAKKKAEPAPEPAATEPTPEGLEDWE